MSHSPIFSKERLQLNPESEMDIQLIDLGENKYPAIVVDNFYRDPDYFREIAISMYYSPDPRTAYPGTVSELSLGSEQITNFLYPKLAHIYGYSEEEFKESTRKITKFSLVGSGVDDFKLQIEHTDPNLFQGLVFLNLPERCKGGTVFFKHRVFGIEEMINDHSVAFLALNKLGVFEKNEVNTFLDTKALKFVMEKGAFSGYLKFREQGIFKNYFDLLKITALELAPMLGLWDESKTIEMKYNRLICFPGFLVHALRCESGWFGDSLEKRRLTQNFCFSWPLLK
jgi:hypothetical protein